MRAITFPDNLKPERQGGRSGRSAHTFQFGQIVGAVCIFSFWLSFVVLIFAGLLTASVFAQPAPTITQGFVTMNFEWDWSLQQTVQPPPTVWSPGNNGPGIGAFSQNSAFAYYLIPFHPAVQTRLRSY